MKVQSLVRGLVVATILAMLGALLPQLASAAPEKASGRYLVRARSSADYTALRAKAVKEGARVLRDLKQVNTMVVSAPASARTSLAADRRTLSVAKAGIRKLDAEVGAPNLDARSLENLPPVARIDVRGESRGCRVRDNHPIPREVGVPGHVLRHEQLREHLVIRERDDIRRFVQIDELASRLQAARIFLLDPHVRAERKAVERRAQGAGETARVEDDNRRLRRSARHEERGQHRTPECDGSRASHGV